MVNFERVTAPFCSYFNESLYVSATQKKLAEWLQCAESSDYVHLGYQSDFDIATVHYEQKNDGETLTLMRWSAEQRQRRLQGEE